MAVLNTSRLGLPYPDGNDLLRDGDNRIHDLAEALDTIVATVDELEAIELTPGPPGPSGQSAGKIFYYATSDASDIATYKTLLESPSAAAEQTVAVACTGTSDVLVAAFASEPGVPGAVDYPAGTAFRRIYAKTDAGVARLHIQVYKRNAAGTETLVRDEYSPNFINTTVALQEWIASSAAAGALLSTDRIVNKIYAQRVSGTSTVNVTTYFEGSAHTSHIQTTISAGAQGPVGPTGPTGPAGAAGSIAAHYKGAWSSATAYAVDDVVTKDGSSYVCLSAHTNSDPAAGAADTTAASVGPAADQPLESASNGIAQTFTPTSTLLVDKIKATWWAAPAAGTYRIGITSTLPAGSPPSTWVGGASNYVDRVNPVIGDFTVTLPARATLASGTTYYVVVYNAPGEIRKIGFKTTAAVGTGCTGGAMRYGTDFGSTGAAFEMPFTLYTTATSPWGLLASKGVGLPAGGTTGQVLKKLSGADYDVGWVT